MKCATCRRRIHDADQDLDGNYLCPECVKKLLDEIKKPKEK